MVNYLLLLALVPTQALVAPIQANSGWSSGIRTTLPKFDAVTSKWVATDPSHLPEACYPPTRTLIMQGPKPYLTRIFQPDDYEQAVLKFMAVDQCSREVAQGNMDAYLRNPQDWQFARLEEKRLGIKYDYTTVNTNKLVLTVVWSAFLMGLAGRAVYSAATGDYYWDFIPWTTIHDVANS